MDVAGNLLKEVKLNEAVDSQKYLRSTVKLIAVTTECELLT